MLFVHQRFERVASAEPEATAVTFGQERLRYRELNQRANQLARYLESRGIGAESRVVVCLEPGFDIVTSLLAIFKVGAAYVPLDPSYPGARIETILSDTEPDLILTRSELTQKLPRGRHGMLELDRAERELAQQRAVDVPVRIDPHQTASVYYTSGTTGQPKGVMASYANVSCYIGAAQDRYGFSSTDVMPALARFGFSISMFELMNPLVAGGTLLMLPREHVLDLAQLSKTLERVTSFHAGPTLLRSLLKYIAQNHPDSTAFERVRHASSGGDMVPVEVLAKLRDTFPRAEVFVIYGCSEISCMGTTYEVPRHEPLHKAYVGKAFDHVTLRVVDDELRAVQPGEVGEVLFAGPGVVKGYLKRPELTAERFIELDGKRFYRTGDRGRLGAGGLLELVGRGDFQVKIGGIRVEPAEIEHHLRRVPGVENGVVVGKQLAESAEKSLVAYVVPEAGAPGDSRSRATAIRRYLSSQLPDYMVPSLVVELPALPVNHNMKLDRNALPDPPHVLPGASPTPAARAPRSETERLLAGLWQKVLGVSAVGLDDNFFDLGGQSASALQVIVEVDRELGVGLTGLEILREPLEMLARICDERAGRPVVPLAAAAPIRSRADVTELFHFGPDQSLFGVLHGTPAAESAVLICAPLGHEYLRSHFVLQRLARRLADAGVPTLRFDYFGCGDSLGESRHATRSRWQSDIVAAARELAQRTGARRIIGLGVRLGATLLTTVCQNYQFEKLVLWDPIEDGSRHVSALVEAHRRHLRSRPSFRLRLPNFGARGVRELLGVTYGLELVRELGELRQVRADALSCPVRILRTDSGWLDVTQLEDMLPDLGTSTALASLVQEVT